MYIRYKTNQKDINSFYHFHCSPFNHICMKDYAQILEVIKGCPKNERNNNLIPYDKTMLAITKKYKKISSQTH